MRPVRFVALSEDGMALILTDEVGRMLSLTIDESVVSAIRRDAGIADHLPIEVDASLTPRDIQARIRAGDSATEVARIANVPVEKVLRFAGPVLQERAAMVQVARRTRLKSSDNNATLGDVSDVRLRDHGVDPDIVAWDAFRRDNGSWRIRATWQSGKATATAKWDLDKGRSIVSAVDEMAQFLSTDRQPILAQDPELPTRPKIAAAKVFTDDDDTDPREGPVVPAVSMLRRDRDKRATRPTPAPLHSKPAGAVSASQVSDSPTSSPATNPEPELDTEPDQDLTAAQVPSSDDAPTEQPPPQHREPLPTWDDILFGSR